MDDLRTLYFQIPPITRYYLTSLFITATIATYIKSLAFIIYAIFLDYNLIIKKFHIWRLFTNVLFFGGFSPQFLFFVIMVYFHFKSQERTSIILRSYATFIMMLIYLLIFINIINIIATKMFGFNAGFTLGPQLILSLIYIDSKREPQKIVSLYFFRMQNCYFPYALILLNIVSGGGIYDNIIGIIAGNLYYTLKDVLPVSKNINILKTPKLLVDLIEKYYYSRLPNDDTNNNNNENNNGFGFGNSGVMNRGRGGNNNNNASRGFTAFGGRGYTVG